MSSPRRSRPHVLIIGQSHSTAARIFAVAMRQQFTFDYFHVPDTTAQSAGDFLVGDPDVIVLADISADEQVWFLTLISTDRPDIGSRIILLTRDASDGRLCDLAAQLALFAVLPIPFGVEQLGEALSACASRLAPAV